jgi:glycyl-tRNA synthetase
MEIFVRPGDEIMSSGRARLKWHLSLGLGEENYRFTIMRN